MLVREEECIGIFLLFLLAVGQGFAPRPAGRHKLPLPLPTVSSTSRIRTCIAKAHPTAKENDYNNIDIPILYETDRLLVINKPAGIPHHTTTTEELGILALIRQKQQQQQKQFDGNSFPYKGRIYGVHRLDAATSGILVLAKDAGAASELTAIFRRSSSNSSSSSNGSSSSSSSSSDSNGLVVKKYYTGISRHKANNKKQGWIIGNMVRGRRKSWLLTPLCTDNKTIKQQQQQQQQSSSNFAKTRFFTAGLGGLQAHHHHHHHTNACSTGSHTTITAPPAKTLLFFRPYTGRTHQLRVAAKSVGLPLAGDPIYRDKFMSSSSQQQQQHAAMDRTYLHATGLFLPPSALTGKNGLAIWCPPSFEETLWDAEGQAKFRNIFYTLVRKHCDCPELLNLLPVAPDNTTTSAAAATTIAPSQPLDEWMIIHDPR